ncbi:hypothetical protein Villemi_00012 [Pseudomonas phage vB_PpuP-Villemi]
MIVHQSKLRTHEAKLLERRQGVSTKVLQLLSRSRELDLLMPEDQVVQEEHQEVIPLPGGENFVILHKYVTGLKYPVAGYPPPY